MTIIYHEQDGDPSFLLGKKVALIGYGSMGQPLALNLRDSGVEVLVGTRPDGQDASRQKALQDGFAAYSISEAVQATHIALMTIPDEVMPAVYLEQVAPYLRRNDALVFVSAYNVAFGFIEAPPFVDVGLIAPRTLGNYARKRYLSGEGFYSFVSVGQDASGNCWDIVLALAGALGSLKAGAIEINFEREAELDLFIEQAILPAFQHIMVTAANMLIEQGYPPEAVLADLYLSGEFVDYLERVGKEGLMNAMHDTAPHTQYGLLSRIDRFNELKLERLMEITLQQIRDGTFAREWAKEYEDGYPRMKRLAKLRERLEIWELEKQTIELLRRFDSF